MMSPFHCLCLTVLLALIARLMCVCHPIFSLATALAYHMAMQTVLF